MQIGWRNHKMVILVLKCDTETMNPPFRVFYILVFSPDYFGMDITRACYQAADGRNDVNHSNGMCL